MNEESDKPNVSGVVRSTSMKSLNDDLAPPTTEKPHEELKDNKKDSITTKLIQRARSFFSKSKGKSSKLEVECESERNAVIAEMENEAEKKLREEMENLKSESDANNTMAGMENAVKLNEEIHQLLEHQTELLARIAQLEDEVKAAKDRQRFRPTEFTLHADFAGISNLVIGGEPVCSPPLEIDGIAWRMSVCKYFGAEESAVLVVDLRAEKDELMYEATEWRCPVFAELQVISQRTKQIDYQLKSKLVYDTQNPSQTIGVFTYQYLLGEEKGIAKDDAISLAVAVRAFPRNVDEAPKTTLHAQFSEIPMRSWAGRYLVDQTTSQDVLCDNSVTVFEGITWSVSYRSNMLEDMIVSLHAEKLEEGRRAVDWWCPVIVDIRFVSQNSGETVHIKHVKTAYHARNICEIIGEVRNKDLFDEEKGFVKDDSVVVVVDITVFPTD